MYNMREICVIAHQLSKRKNKREEPDRLTAIIKEHVLYALLHDYCKSFFINVLV